jgi:hypothetical protein
LSAPELFPEGKNAVIREALFSREIMPNGVELIYVKDTNGDLFFKKFLTQDEKNCKGTGKGRGRTRGKQGVIKVTEKAMSLGDADIGFLIRLGKHARFDTGLLANRKKPLLLNEIYEVMKVNDRTGRRYMTALIMDGAVIKRDDGYYINKDYITKG